MSDLWEPLHTVVKRCGFGLTEVDKVVNVTIPYDHCLKKEVWQIHSVPIVPEEMTLLFLLLGWKVRPGIEGRNYGSQHFMSSTDAAELSSH